MTNSSTQSPSEKSAEELRYHLDAIEREVRRARNEPVENTPWDFNLPAPGDFQYMREECGLTRAEVGEAIDYAEQSIYQVETGSTPPGREMIQKLLILYKREWPR